MGIDPFEEFKKKKEEQQQTAQVDESFYEIPKDSAEGSVSGLITHRFEDTDNVTVEKPSGFEDTQLGNGLKDEAPQVEKPKGFESNSIVDNDS